MSAVVVDDEPLARQIVREYLSHHHDIIVAAECGNGFDAVKVIAETKPQLLFLDIQMPKLNGFEVLELIEHDVVVIFTTAYDEFALKAFEVHAADYLLKPFSQERFDEALAQARAKLGSQSADTLDALVRERHVSNKPAERVLIRDGAKVHIIPVGKIDYVEAEDDYVAVCSEGKRYLKQMRLSALEAELDPHKFVRIHRSYILNLDRLAKIELYAKDSRVAILRDGTKLQVSRTGYAKLKQFL
ncbi:MAG: response regulator transcription factor [Ignavibacteriae bacterium]|nr:response regulator transcription factor [Ignavibacteriota bacterium]